MKTTTSTIYMKRWLEANGRTRTLPGDSWYLNFTNEMLPLIAASPLFANKTADKITNHCSNRRLESIHHPLRHVVRTTVTVLPLYKLY